MLNLYEEYASQEEREDAVMLEQAEIQMDRAILALETCDAMRDLNIREAECKLVMESGDACDLVEYYGEAAEQTEEKEKGLLTKAWEAILKFLNNIKETLFGKAKPKADPNQKYDVDESFLERHKKLGAAVEAIKKFFSNPIKAIGAIVVAGGVIAAFLAIKKTGKKKSVDGQSLNNMENTAEKAVDQIEGGLKGFLSKFGKKKNGDQENEAQSFISKVVKVIREHITEGFNAIKNNHLQARADRAVKKGTSGSGKPTTDPNQLAAASEYASYGGTLDESAEDDDLSGGIYDEDAGDLSDIAELLATL